MRADSVFAQAGPTVEGVPWWVSLIVVPVLGVLLEGLRRLLKVEKAPEPKPPPTDSTQPAPKPPPPSASADEKMVYVEQLIGEITRSRDEATRELEEAEATIERLRARLRDQDNYIAQLQAMLGRFVPPGPMMGPPTR